ncbi:unnamed protein product [Protopolystoma xenopodis]|uniref:Uncharacterized protein n=1 Tax=Protopolystoma xenopodis TaxID=117903 RepID=A0A3S5FG29_9PLAT|nr:unnamed protein product [Protopolystoma xenopodis]
MCTTFELRARSHDLIWNRLHVEIQQDPVTGAIATGQPGQMPPIKVITHERGELPFSAYDRHIDLEVVPGTEVSLYFSKHVYRRLSTSRNPCFDGADAKELAETPVFEEQSEEENDFSTNQAQIFDEDRNTIFSYGQTRRATSWPLDALDLFRIRSSTGAEHDATGLPENSIKDTAISVPSTSMHFSSATMSAILTKNKSTWKENSHPQITNGTFGGIAINRDIFMAAKLLRMFSTGFLYTRSG